MIQIPVSLLVSVIAKLMPSDIIVTSAKMVSLTSREVMQLVAFHAAVCWMALRTGIPHVMQPQDSVTAKIE